MINPCTICQATCCKTYRISVTSFDVKRISDRGIKSDFVEFHKPTMLAYDPDTILDFEDDYRGGILGFKSHPCYFLKDNRCTIHRFAPLSCKRYPFTIYNSLNPRFCPIPCQLLFRMKTADIQSSPVITELAKYKIIVKEWNKNPGKKKDCLQFLLERTIL
ncbi:YkgJ family cysteine cluster protein [Candidatus Micrarchaeota archaeon]|nr:YkgJ family cysteine cluster protein [Candidatus Micrarchaeota archaeon]